MSILIPDQGEFVHVDGVCYQRINYEYGTPDAFTESDVFPNCLDCFDGLLTGDGESLLTGGGEPLGV